MPANAKSLRRLAFALGAASLIWAGVAGPAAAQTNDEQAIRETLIAQSIEAYSGTCACPYSVTADGDPCGANSAWSRGGGDAPLCFDEDVTDEMVRAYLEENG